MVQLSPDNGTSGWDRIAGYFWPDTTIAGFSHTHLSGTGAGDLYDISYMPAVPPFRIGKGELGVYSTFSHRDETAEAGYDFLCRCRHCPGVPKSPYRPCTR